MGRKLSHDHQPELAGDVHGTERIFSLDRLRFLLSDRVDPDVSLGPRCLFRRLYMQTFVKELGTILVVGSLLTFYTSPLPGAGVGFSHLITDEAKYLSDRLESNSTTAAMVQLNQSLSKVEQPVPGWSRRSAICCSAFWYFFIQFLLGFEKLTLIGVLAVAYVALGVVVLVGPLFIPWLMFPGLEFLAWGWFKAYLQYCFYLVVAAAVTFLNATVMLEFFDVHPLPWTVKDTPGFAIELLVVVGINVYVVLQVPDLLRPSWAAVPRIVQ